MISIFRNTRSRIDWIGSWAMRRVYRKFVYCKTEQVVNMVSQLRTVLTTPGSQRHPPAPFRVGSVSTTRTSTRSRPTVLSVKNAENSNVHFLELRNSAKNGSSRTANAISIRTLSLHHVTYSFIILAFRSFTFPFISHQKSDLY